MSNAERIARYRRAIARLGDRIAALEQPPDPGTWPFWVEAGGSRTGAPTFEAALDLMEQSRPDCGVILDAGGRVVMAYERRRQDDEPSGRSGAVVSGAGAGPATGGPAGYPGETPEVCAGRIPVTPEGVQPHQEEEVRVPSEAKKAAAEAGQPGNGIG